MDFRIPALLLLIALLACPFLIMAWWFLPIAAGLCVWAYFKLAKKKTVRRFTNPILLAALLAFLVWLCFNPWKLNGIQPVEASRTNRAAYTAFGRSRDESSDTAARNLSSDRRAMWLAIETQRLALKKIAAALDVNESANDYAKRNDSTSADMSSLGSALTNLEDTFAKNGTPVPGSLMDPSNLGTYVEQSGRELAEIERITLDPEATSDQLRRNRLGLANRLAPYKGQVLYDAVQRVENALRQIFKVDLGTPVAENTVTYDRASDEIVSTQVFTIDLGGHKASSIDVSGLIPQQITGKALSIKVRQDDHKDEDIDLADPRVPLDGARQIVITRLLAHPNASRPVFDSRLWVPFREISVQWPFPLSSSVRLAMLYPDGSSGDWPYVVALRSSDTETLKTIHVPRNSYFFSEDVVPPPPDVSDLTLLPSAPHLASLAWDKSIKVQLLPWYLSNKICQRLKEYLALESIIGSLLIATISAGLAAVLTRE